MARRNPHYIKSALSGLVTKDEITVDVFIFRLQESTRWSLKVVNAAGTSIEWHRKFPSDDAALNEFRRTVTEEKIVPFDRVQSQGRAGHP